MKTKMQNKLFLPAVFLLCLTLLPVGCGEEPPTYNPDFVGRWRMTSFVTDSGIAATIQNNLDIVFYETGIGELQKDGELYYLFDYTAEGGKLTRVIARGDTETTLEETYVFSDNLLTLTIHTPGTGESDPAATITLQRVAE